MHSPPNRPTMAVPVEFSRDRVIVNEGACYAAPIIPESHQQLNRKIDVHNHAVLQRQVIGRVVNVGEHCSLGSSVFGERKVLIGAGTKIAGHVMSTDRIEIGDGCEVGDDVHRVCIVGNNVKIGRRCMVNGSVVAREHVTIHSSSIIDGIVCCTEGAAEIEDGVAARDFLSRQDLKLGKDIQVKDNVVWARGLIQYTPGSLFLSGAKVTRESERDFQGAELNLNVERSHFHSPDHYPAEKDTLEFVKGLVEEEDTESTDLPYGYERLIEY